MKNICERCGQEHDGSFASGRFCSDKCSRKRVLSQETRDKIAVSVKAHAESLPAKIFSYTCEKCGKAFEQKKPMRKNYKVHCSSCRRVRRPKYTEYTGSILELSKRTIGKVLYRAKAGCGVCGWSEGRCDIHHIIPTSKGGGDENSNLVLLCPNHHRLAHEKPEKYNAEILSKISISNKLYNWNEFVFKVKK